MGFLLTMSIVVPNALIWSELSSSPNLILASSLMVINLGVNVAISTAWNSAFALNTNDLLSSLEIFTSPSLLANLTSPIFIPDSSSGNVTVPDTFAVSVLIFLRVNDAPPPCWLFISIRPSFASTLNTFGVFATTPFTSLDTPP